MSNLDQKFEKLFARLFMVLVSILLCASTSEIIYRTFVKEKLAKGTWMLTDDNHVPRPYVMATGRPGSPIEGDTHNELGYRGALPVMPKPKNEFRIIVLGGSTVHFNQVDLPRHIANAAHKENIGKNVAAYNFGIASSVSQQDLVRLVTDVIEYDPDLVIHYGGGNDVFAFVDPRINYPHRFALYEKKVYEGQSVREYPLIHNILMASQMYRDFFVQDILEQDFEKDSFARPPYNQTEDLRVAAYTQNMALMNHIADSFGIKFLSVIQPMVHFKKHPAGELENSFANKTEEVAMQNNRLKSILDSFAKNQFAYADCSDVYATSEDIVFRDYIHLIDGKDSLPGDCIWKSIKERNFLNIAKRPAPLKLIPSHLFFTGNPLK